MAVQQQLWGSETSKAVDNFPVSGQPVPVAVIRMLGAIKAAAARTNAELGLLDAELAERIAAAALIAPSILITGTGTRCPETGKFSTALLVSEPHSSCWIAIDI